ELKNAVDTLITIPNQRLLAVADERTTLLDTFKKADEVLLNAVQGISDLITIPGLINVDFADVRTIMSNMGVALMGTGRAVGPERAMIAAKMAVESPLLEDVQIDGATGILINITGGANMTLVEVNQACSLIQEAAHEDANIIFGSVISEDMDASLKITVIATGFSGRDGRRIDRSDATRVVRPPPPPLESAARAVPRAAESPRHASGPARAGAPPPPPAKERPVRHISWEELRQMTGATEDELDVPTFLRNQE
ncbi:MAG: cell division protein FtsZ, partial [Myxococcales bacterium]